MTITIIGYGQFGKLLAKLLSPYLEKIYLVSSKQLTNLPKGCQQMSLEQAVNKSQLIIPSIPMQNFDLMLEKIAPLLQPDTIIVDVSSVKVYPIEQMQRLLPSNVSILATHPLFGPISINEQGLVGQQIVLCPTRINLPQYQMIKDFLTQKLGLVTIEMSPAEHDQEMAWIHGLSFFVGRGLTQMSLPKLKLNTGYFKKLIELSETEKTHSWELFETVQIFNPYAKKVRQDFLDILSKLNQHVLKSEKNDRD
ncbi:prephenate dehydrogenase [Candidatus Saccharibacteria bacterium]|nr:prephenate dehydrogenase [Candidatus Saccharibacteria bacterium]